MYSQTLSIIGGAMDYYGNTQGRSHVFCFGGTSNDMGRL